MREDGAQYTTDSTVILIRPDEIFERLISDKAPKHVAAPAAASAAAFASAFPQTSRGFSLTVVQTEFWL
jgi:hypothetical protein